MHTSRIVEVWFHNHPEITVLPHPPRSPDLNPIEHVWAVMTKMCAENDARHNRAAVVRSAQKAWEELRAPKGQELPQSLVASMPRRLNSVLADGGGYTKYWLQVNYVTKCIGGRLLISELLLYLGVLFKIYILKYIFICCLTTDEHDSHVCLISLFSCFLGVAFAYMFQVNNIIKKIICSDIFWLY